MARKNEHEICVYEEMFKAGFQFPFPKIVRELLHYLSDSPSPTGPKCLANFLCVCDPLAKGPRRRT
jgi:hypothetical protein